MMNDLSTMSMGDKLKMLQIAIILRAFREDDKQSQNNIIIEDNDYEDMQMRLKLLIQGNNSNDTMFPGNNNFDTIFPM